MEAWNAAVYEEMQAQYQYRYGKQLADRLIELTGIPEGRAADLGCGEGSLAGYLYSLAGSGLTIQGVDLDAGMIERARQKNPRLQFTCMDLLDWAEQVCGGYHLFYSNAALHWLKSWERFEYLLTVIDQKLLPGGHIAFHFSLCQNGLALKGFLQQGLRDFLKDEDITILPSVYTYDGVNEMLEHRFDILYAEELREQPFSTQPDLSFDWMVKSQPIGRFISSNDYEAFTAYLYQRWRESPVELSTHQCSFIAEKR